MRKLILAATSAAALLAVAACSDSGPGVDQTTTQGVNPPPAEQPAPKAPEATPPADQPAQPAPAAPANPQ